MGSKLTVILRDPKHHLQNSSARASTDESGDRLMTQVHLTVGPLGVWTHPMVISWLPTCTIAIYLAFLNLPTHPLTYRARTVRVLSPSEITSKLYFTRDLILALASLC